MGNRKQKDKLNFWLKMWSGLFKKFELEFGIWLRNKKGYFQSGRLREVVAMRELTVLGCVKAIGILH